MLRNIFPKKLFVGFMKYRLSLCTVFYFIKAHVKPSCDFIAFFLHLLGQNACCLDNVCCLLKILHRIYLVKNAYLNLFKFGLDVTKAFIILIQLRHVSYEQCTW